MIQKSESRQYRVWALDDSMYGPVAAEVLRDWVRDERMVAESWVFCETTQRWRKAGQMPELRALFGEAPEAEGGGGVGMPLALKPAILRRIRAFGDLSDDDLAEVVRLGELIELPAFQTIMRSSSPSDFIYFIIDGKVRQRIMVRSREVLIAVKEAGASFGYISLFDGGPHITDAISDTAVTLFRMPTDRLRDLCTVKPEIGVPMLFSLGRSLAGRIRSDDRHLYELVVMNQGRT